MASKSKLPKRFQPLLQQANTETDIRYGAQESALQSILNSLTQDYGQQSQAADTASRSLAGLLQGAGSQLQQSYTDAGLTPNVMAQIANSPTGQRLAGELAREQASIQQQQLGAQAGAAYQQQHLHDQYLQNVGKVQDQAQALVKERGEYGADLLNQLISGDRSARHAANQELRNQAFQQAQSQAAQQASLTNTTVGALLDQGLQPKINKDGSISVSGVIPGGKADPNSPLNQQKATKPKAASKPTGADRDIQKDFTKAMAWIKQLDHPNAIPDPAKRREAIKEILTKGDQTAGYPSIPSAGLDAALDMYFDKALSPQTVNALHSAGVKVKFLTGVKTRTQLGPPPPPPPAPPGGAPPAGNNPFGIQFGNPLTR